MDSSDWATVIVASISVASAALSGRAAKIASKYTSTASVINSKTQAETEAYNRARAMDIQTIKRQDEELAELQGKYSLLEEKYKALKLDNEGLHEDNDRLRRRVSRLERLEERLKELGYSVD